MWEDDGASQGLTELASAGQAAKPCTSPTAKTKKRKPVSPRSPHSRKPKVQKRVASRKRIESDGEPHTSQRAPLLGSTASSFNQLLSAASASAAASAPTTALAPVAAPAPAAAPAPDVTPTPAIAPDPAASPLALAPSFTLTPAHHPTSSSPIDSEDSVEHDVSLPANINCLMLPNLKTSQLDDIMDGSQLTNPSCMLHLTYNSLAHLT